MKNITSFSSSVSRKILIGVFSLFVFAFVISLPILASAQGSGSTSTSTPSYCGNQIKEIKDIFNFFTCLISQSIIPLLFSVALMVFIWGVIQFVINGSEEKKREEGKKFMLYGIISLFVMVSIWGIVKLLTTTFGFNSTVVPTLPS